MQLNVFSFYDYDYAAGGQPTAPADYEKAGGDDYETQTGDYEAYEEENSAQAENYGEETKRNKQNHKTEGQAQGRNEPELVSEDEEEAEEGYEE